MPVFLEGGGECGALIKARDWSGTLGPVEQWPQSLKAATSLLLHSPVAMVMLWGEDGIMLYNDAYSEFAGGRHPEQLGMKVREGWPEVADFNDHVMKVGLSGGTLSFKDQKLILYRHGEPEQVWMDLDYSPVMGDDGRPAGVLVIVIETTERVKAEQALRHREARLRFFDRLAQATRQLSGAREIMATTTRALGEQLGGSVCAYADMEPDQDGMNIRADWAADGSASIVGTYSLAAFGETARSNLLAGRPLITCDTLAELGPVEGAALLGLGIRATVCMPLIRDGKLRALMALHQREPRNWTDQEQALIGETTERSWAYIERVRAEEVNREIARRLNAVLDNTTMAVFLMDHQQRCVFANAAAEKLTGYSFAELSAKPLHDVIHHKYPDGRHFPLEECAIDRVFPERSQVQGEELFVAPNGTFYPVAFTASPVLNDDGQPIGTVIEARNISEERARDAALRESEERFRNIADHTPAMLWVTDETGYCDYLNKGWYDYTGQGDQTGEGFGWLQAVHPDDRPAAERAFLRATEEQAGYEIDFRVRRADGTYRWCVDTAKPRFDGSGRFLGYVGSVIDIDERREAAEKVRASEEILRNVIDQMPIGVAIARVPSGEIFLYNQALEEMLGHSILSDGTGTYGRYGGIDEEGRPLPADGYSLARAVMYGETTVGQDMRYRRGDGRIIHLLNHAAPIIGPSGAAEIAVVTLQDISDRKKAEQHQRLLIDELSHRAKNLLAIIQSVAQQSFKNGSEPAAMVASFEGRLGALAAAHGILTRQRWEAAPIRQIICDTITAVKADDHRLKLDGPDLLVPPKTSVSLAMAIHELTTNATKYGSFSNETGSVTVRWQVEEGRLKLEWRERGGPVVTKPQKRGFGSRMIERGLAAELGGEVTISFEPEGVVCRVDAPFQAAA